MSRLSRYKCLRRYICRKQRNKVWLNQAQREDENLQR